MVQPERCAAEPLEAFLGRTSVIDTYTREEEDAFEYVCRHTLLRPRDLMTIGERLTALRPDERRNEYRLKEAVNQAATEIAHEYLAEIAPYVGGLDLERLFQRLPGHVITRAEVEALFRSTTPRRAASRRSTSSARSTASACSATCSTTACAANGASGSCARAKPTLETNGALPRATHYLLHPVLFDVIGRHQPGVPAAHRPRQHRRLRPAVARDGAVERDRQRAAAAC